MLLGGVGSVLPAAMAELAPWRVRCTVLSVGGVKLAPAVYLAAARAITFIAALLLPRVRAID